MRKVIIRNRTRETILADDADLADTSETRCKGLLGRETLHPGQGLWIVPCESVHTFGMKFAIDVLYLDRKKKVRKTRTAMVPWRVSMSLLAHSVLELPAGTLTRTQTQPGDQLEVLFTQTREEFPF